jgi:hypothetical protein
MILPHYFRLYVPCTEQADQPISQAEQADRAVAVAAELAALFGGSTIQPGLIGCWMSDRKGLIKEAVTYVTAYTDRADPETYDHMIALAERLKAAWQQESIALETESGLILV